MSHTVPLHAADSAAPEVDLSSDERVAALCDLSYCAGLKAGWNYCTDGDHAGFARSMESAREAVAVLNEHRLKCAPAAQVARAEQEPVAWIRKNGFRFIAEIEPQDGSEVPLYAAPPAQHDASVLVEALEKIANWADGGSEYGQDKIKAFARSALASKGVVGGIRGW